MIDRTKSLDGRRINAPTKVAPAKFAFIWPAMLPDFPALDCYNLTADIPGHPTNSTVCGATLNKEGWTVPAAEQSKANAELAALK